MQATSKVGKGAKHWKSYAELKKKLFQKLSTNSFSEIMDFMSILK